jgi:ribulose-phosphate 3-epimerase
MQATICPTITAANPDEYKAQMERIEPFAMRIHVDIMDGTFAPNCGIGIDEIWWRGDRTIDLHMMYQRPSDHLDLLLTLKPRLVIIHAEADGDYEPFAEALHNHGVEVGVALLPKTTVDWIADSMKHIDHVLIFSGDLGHFGGTFDPSLLEKVRQVRALKRNVEIGWDGGINEHNEAQLIEAGVDVLNVGGFIQKAQDPQSQYHLLVDRLQHR